ncbi:MAG TPA: hypothetical protein DCY89_03120 [Gammaproteobacteria bacterium]|nr:hypothetical protein [Gammaproteobacteria bacterium]
MKHLSLLRCGLLWRCFAGCLAFGYAVALPALAQEDESPVTTPPATAETNILVPPGKFLVVQGLRMHMHCVGSGYPAVMIDGGIGASSLEWIPVLEGAASTTRVCVWDRPGYGWSDAGPAPRTTPQVADELLDLMKASEIAGPWVLVGHSFGGFTVRYLAARHPAEVAALLLVESSTPTTEVVASRGPRRASPLVEQPKVSAAGMPRTREEVASYLNTRRKAILTQMDELKHFHASSQAVQQAGPVPDVPLIVLERGRRLWPVGTEGDAAEQAWHDAQAELVRLTPQGQLRTIPDVGHSPHVDRPEVVVAAIRELVQLVRERKPIGGPVAEAVTTEMSTGR